MNLDPTSVSGDRQLATKSPSALRSLCAQLLELAWRCVNWLGSQGMRKRRDMA